MYFRSPSPALFPYAVIGIGLFVTFFGRNRTSLGAIGSHASSSIHFSVIIYASLVLANTGWQVGLQLISLAEGIAVLVNYLLPVIFYYYFRRFATEHEICSAIRGIALVGIVLAIYFVYDTYMKMVLGQVSIFSESAFEYSLERANQSEDLANTARIASGGRSLGLLESSAVSGAWTVLSACATLALVPLEYSRTRRLTIGFFGIVLLIALNFTAILGYYLIIVVFEAGLNHLKASRASIFFTTSILAGSMVGISALLQGGFSVDNYLFELIIDSLVAQVNILTGTELRDNTMLSLVVIYLREYLEVVYDSPLLALVGEGFSSYGTAKGGDVGFVETMSRFGPLFFLLFTVGLCKLLIRGLRLLARMEPERNVALFELNRRGIIQFSLSVIVLVGVSDGHYSTWTSKAVLPFLFFSLAMLDRYLLIRFPVTTSNPRLAG